MEREPKRPRPVDDVDEEDQAWQDWINDDSGKTKAPLPPLVQPEVGIHAPTPEMDEEDRRRQEEYERRKRDEHSETHPRGVWEMKK